MYVALAGDGNEGMCRETKMERDGREERERERGNRRGGVTKADGTLGIHLSLKSVSAVFLMCTRL